MKKLAFLLLLVLLLAGCAPAPMENAAPAKVFLTGEGGGVKTALDLAAQTGTIKLVTDMAQADVLVLDGVIPPGAAERAQAGAGVVLILGEGVTNDQASALLGQPVTLIPAENAVSLSGAKGVSDALLTEIVYALAGGWDEAGLDEADEASHMTGFLRPVVNFIFIAPSRWGPMISPLHNRFPITMRTAALAEAQALTEEWVKLVTGP